MVARRGRVCGACGVFTHGGRRFCYIPRISFGFFRAANWSSEMSVDGDWNLQMTTPMGARDVKMKLSAAGEVLSGAFAGAAGEAPLNGTITADSISFVTTVPTPMGNMELTFTGKPEGDSMGGTVAFGAFGNGPWSAKRA